MGNPVARLGDRSSHGGVIITSAKETTADGILIARIGDLHDCPLKGHGITPILTGAGNYSVEGALVARTGSVTGCGAVIIGGAINLTTD